MDIQNYVKRLTTQQLMEIGRQTVLNTMSAVYAIEQLVGKSGLDEVIEEAGDQIYNNIWRAAIFTMGVMSASSGEFWTAVQNGSYLHRMKDITQS